MLRGHGGIVMGSDAAGGIRNVTASNCVFIGTDRGIRIKSNRGRYSVFEDIRFNNIIMKDVMCPLVMNLYYTCGATERTKDYVSDPNPRPVIDSTPRIRNIHVSNVTARGHMAAAGALIGLPEHPIENVTLDNVIIDAEPRDNPCHPAMAFNLDKMNGEGIFARNVKNLAIRNCDITVTNGPAINVVAGSEIDVAGTRARSREHGVKTICLPTHE